jgi:hypothetical protein
MTAMWTASRADICARFWAISPARRTSAFSIGITSSTDVQGHLKMRGRWPPAYRWPRTDGRVPMEDFLQHLSVGEETLPPAIRRSRIGCASVLSGCAAPIRYIGMLESTKINPGSLVQFRPASGQRQPWGMNTPQHAGPLPSSFLVRSQAGSHALRAARAGPIRQPSDVLASPDAGCPTFPGREAEPEDAYSHSEHSKVIGGVSQRRTTQRCLPGAVALAKVAGLRDAGTRHLAAEALSQYLLKRVWACQRATRSA